VVSCPADDLIDARLDTRQTDKTLGDRLKMVNLREKPADDLRVSGRIRRITARLDARAKMKNMRARRRRKKTKRIISGLL